MFCIEGSLDGSTAVSNKDKLTSVYGDHESLTGVCYQYGTNVWDCEKAYCGTSTGDVTITTPEWNYLMVTDDGLIYYYES